MTVADAGRTTANQGVLERLPKSGAAPRPIGIVANPASGKDIRRLAARASVFDTQEKRAIVARCLIGIRRSAPCPIHYFNDAHGIAESALQSVGLAGARLPVAATGAADDTTRAAAAMQSAGCGVAIVLGGDGTQRAFAKGWRDAPLIALATGTNNAFPQTVEATVAGMAAALVAAGATPLTDVARRAKAIHVDVDGEQDVALIDVAMTTDRFAGARALLDAGRLRWALLTRASPAGVGLASVGGMLQALTDADDDGLAIQFAAPGHPARWRIRAVTAPGRLEDIDVAAARRVALNERITMTGTGALAFDGERERTLTRSSRVHMTVRRDGPQVIDIAGALAALKVPDELMEIPDAV